MKKLIYSLLAISFIIVIGCSKIPFTADTSVDISYSNSSGNDLLDSATTNHFVASDIHLYNMVKGVKIEVNYPYDIPHNFLIYKNDSLKRYFLRVFIETDTTLLELNQTTTDTLICSIEKSESTKIVRKVRYNGNLMWSDFGKPREFSIIKR